MVVVVVVVLVLVLGKGDDDRTDRDSRCFVVRVQGGCACCSITRHSRLATFAMHYSISPSIEQLIIARLRCWINASAGEVGERMVGQCRDVGEWRGYKSVVSSR